MFVVCKNTSPLPIHTIICGGGLQTQMKSRLILKTDGDSPADGKTDFPDDLMQPVLQGPLSKLRPREPAIQPCRGTGGNLASQDLAACHHADTVAHIRNVPLTGYWQVINNNCQNGAGKPLKCNGGIFYKAASTSAACSSGLTCGQIFRMRPSGPMRNVTR